MEKGAMRCEPNVSVRPIGTAGMGVKTEIKNLNSFRAVKLAIEYEIDRQTRMLNSGGRVEQVTMGWNERDNRTVVQRSKEHAEDYRYFPEPDLPLVELSAEHIESARAKLPELPEAKRGRFAAEHGLRPQDAAVLAADREVADYYERCVAAAAAYGVDARTVCNWVSGELFRLSNEASMSVAQVPVTPQGLGELLDHLQRGVIHANAGKQVLAEMFRTGESAGAIIAVQGLAQVQDTDVIGEMVDRVLRANPDPVAQYLGGKETALGFLIGQVMRASGGKVNPQLARKALKDRLDSLR
jgi:aspartyl-tRNA(Asn)/glutamyl-tRNA(Gln) amidotransferase subunit B